MFTIEIAALATMAVVFVFTIVQSAQSHSRTSAWAAPANLTPIFQPTVVSTNTGIVIDAQDRFAARRAADETSNDLTAIAA